MCGKGRIPGRHANHGHPKLLDAPAVTNNFARRVALLHPVEAVLIVLFGPVFFVILTRWWPLWQLPEDIVFAVVYTTVYLVWPVLTVFFLNTFSDLIYRPGKKLVSFLFVNVFVLFMFVRPIDGFLEAHGLIGRIVEGAMVCSIFFSVLYIPWTASRAMTAIEDGHRRITWRTFWTFLQFGWSPLTIWLIQKRLRRIDGSRSTTVIDTQ